MATLLTDASTAVSDVAMLRGSDNNIVEK